MKVNKPRRKKEKKNRWEWGVKKKVRKNTTEKKW